MDICVVRNVCVCVALINTTDVNIHVHVSWHMSKNIKEWKYWVIDYANIWLYDKMSNYFPKWIVPIMLPPKVHKSAWKY